MNSIQNHPRCNKHNSNFHQQQIENQPSKVHWPRTPQHPPINTHSVACAYHGHRSQQRSGIPSPPSPRKRQGGILRFRLKDLNSPTDELSSIRESGQKSPKPTLRKLSNSDSNWSPRMTPSKTLSFPKNPHQCIPIEGDPKINDVVCYSFFSSKRRREFVAIQPNSTHKGNLRFFNLIRNRAHSYKRAMDIVSAGNDNNSSSLVSEREQKRITRSVVAEIQSRGGRFLVWIRKNKQKHDHKNNGSWHLVDKEDVRNITRYALLKQAEAIFEEKEADSESGPTLGSQKEPKTDWNGSDNPPAKKVSEPKNNIVIAKVLGKFEDGATVSSTNENTIADRLSGMSVDDDQRFDVWSLSPSVSIDATKNPESQNQSQTLATCCWEYKILLPLTID